MLNEKEADKEVSANLNKLNSKQSAVFDSEDKKTKEAIKMEPVNVHSMPSKFVEVAQRTGQLSPSKNGNGRKIALIAIVLVLLIVVVVAGIIYFSSREANAPVVVPDTTQNQNTNEVVDTNTNENLNQNTNEVVDTNTNESSQQDLGAQQALDPDDDGLSYEEELIFGTSTNLDDTDKDGYRDGQEITSLYNPLLPSQGLAESGLVTRFNNNVFGYSILRPATWLINSVGERTSKIIILPNSETGESFSINVSSNTENKSLEEILNEMFDTLGPSNDYGNYSLDGQYAYRSIDGQRILAINGDFIFVITHDVNPVGAINFISTFEMMLNSFKWTDISI